MKLHIKRNQYQKLKTRLILNRLEMLKNNKLVDETCSENNSCCNTPHTKIRQKRRLSLVF